MATELLKWDPDTVLGEPEWEVSAALDGAAEWSHYGVVETPTVAFVGDEYVWAYVKVRALPTGAWSEVSEAVKLPIFVPEMPQWFGFAVGVLCLLCIWRGSR